MLWPWSREMRKMAVMEREEREGKEMEAPGRRWVGWQRGRGCRLFSLGVGGS